jgi:hypothetical protein
VKRVLVGIVDGFAKWGYEGLQQAAKAVTGLPAIFDQLDKVAQRGGKGAEALSTLGIQGNVGVWVKDLGQVLRVALERDAGKKSGTPSLQKLASVLTIGCEVGLRKTWREADNHRQANGLEDFDPSFKKSLQFWKGLSDTIRQLGSGLQQINDLVETVKLQKQAAGANASPASTPVAESGQVFNTTG